jgi:hypothetical protein
MPQIYSYEKEFYGKKPREMEISRKEILLVVGLLFVILAMPITFIQVHKLTRYLKYVPNVVDAAQCPTTFGVLLHAVVCVLLLYIALEIPNRYR